MNKRVLTVVFVLLALLATVMQPIMPQTAEASEHRERGREVFVGPWDGLIMCESEGNARARNRYSGADGIVQFMPATWRSVSHRNEVGVPHRAPSDHTVSQQLRNAMWLRDNVGLSQWVCGGYGHGDGWITVTNEKIPKHPKRCYKRLKKKTTKKIARSVCNYDPNRPRLSAPQAM